MKTLLTLCCLLFTSISFAGGYKLYHTQDNVEIHGKWKYEKPFKKGKMYLCLKVKNTAAESALVSLDVNYFNGALTDESFEIADLCIGAGKSAKGRGDNLCFVSENLSNDDLLSDAFRWKVDDMVVEAADNCDKQ